MLVITSQGSKSFCIRHARRGFNCKGRRYKHFRGYFITRLKLLCSVFKCDAELPDSSLLNITLDFDGNINKAFDLVYLKSHIYLRQMCTSEFLGKVVEDDLSTWDFCFQRPRSCCFYEHLKYWCVLRDLTQATKVHFVVANQSRHPSYTSMPDRPIDPQHCTNHYSSSLNNVFMSQCFIAFFKTVCMSEVEAKQFLVKKIK